MQYICNKTPIIDHKFSDGEIVGEFTGTIQVVRDMGPILPVSGTANFLSEKDAERIEIRDLKADLSADFSRVVCLFLEENKEE